MSGSLPDIDTSLIGSFVIIQVPLVIIIVFLLLKALPMRFALSRSFATNVQLTRPTIIL